MQNGLDTNYWCCDDIYSGNMCRKKRRKEGI